MKTNPLEDINILKYLLNFDNEGWSELIDEC